MSIERASHHQQQQLDAQAELQATQFNAQQQPQKPHGHHAPRGHHGGYSYHAKEDRPHRPPSKKLPLKPRPPPRRRAARSVLNDDFDDQSLESDDRDTNDRDKPFDAFNHIANHAMSQDQGGDDTGRDADPQAGAQDRGRLLSLAFPTAQPKTDMSQPKMKAKLGAKRERPRTPEDLVALGLKGASGLVGGPAPVGMNVVTEIIGSMSMLVMSACRSGTGFGPTAPSLTRVGMSASLAAVDRLPLSASPR